MIERYCIVPFCLTVAIVSVLAGCGRQEGQDWQESRQDMVTPGANVLVTPPPEEEPDRRKDVVTTIKRDVKGRFTDEQKQKIVEESLLSLQRVVISSDEKLKLSAGDESSTAAGEALTTKLVELGFQVVQTTDSLAFSPSERKQDNFRRQNDCNLALLVNGKATRADKFGEFWSFKSELKGKVVNLTTHQIIASKTINKRGKRALTESEAAEDAETSAAKDLTTYLTDEIARKWEATSLVKVELVVTNQDNIAMADDVRVGLQKRVGIYYVSLESWDENSQVARYEILCRFDVQRFIPAYVAELRMGNVKVQSVKQKGEAIKAERKNLG